MTPPATATGGGGLVATVAYTAPDSASGSVGSEQWVIAQKPLPLPPGATDLALSATASASYTSPWTTVSAINDGIYPIQSNDDNDLLPPSSWVVQYWNGSAWADISNQNGEPTAINQFNTVSLDPVTTTGLRISMQSFGTASVGVIQRIVPSTA